MRNTWSVILWCAFFAGMIVTLGFVNHAHEALYCKEISIHISQNDENYFVEEDDILALLPFDLATIRSIPAREIEPDNIERQLNNHPAILNAEVYLTLDGKLTIDVDQRKPLARIFTNNNESYYFDNNGFLMPLSPKFTSRVTVISGHIQGSFGKWQKYNMKEVLADDSLRKRTMLDDLFYLTEYIHKDPFWKAQIEHIYVNKDLEIELIPRVGSHTIVLGEIVNIDKKFRKLMVFYEHGLSRTGWNEYSVINLKFENQVVCTKRYNY